jgi:gliding motility-associated lipoprotein GldH
MKARNSLIGILALLLLWSCEQPAFYERSYTFKRNTWEQNVKPRFVVDLKELDKEHVFVLTLRTTTDYKYSNLWVFLNTKNPKGETTREPVEIAVTNPDGSWVGKKTGTIVETEVVFIRSKDGQFEVFDRPGLPPRMLKCSLADAGKYTFMVEQGITQTAIDEVLDLTLLVEKLKPKD